MSIAATRSGLFVGRVSHSRLQPRPHAFSYRLFMLGLDLDELTALDRTCWLFGLRRWKAVRFAVTDCLGVAPSGGTLTDQVARLHDAVRQTLAAHGVLTPIARVTLVTQGRIAGYVFNPVSFLVCYAAGDATPAAVIADVHNTFGERHAYVLPVAEATEPGRWHAKKVFHVSPFFTLDGTYRFALTFSDEVVDARIDLYEAGRAVFVSHLALRRRPFTDRVLAGLLVRFPFMTVRIIAAIHLQAWRLWRKGLAYHPKPDHDVARARATRP